jgi:archaetidylinositol phosphate synthase
VTASRLNDSFLATKERALLHSLVRRLPHWVTPDQLTAMGLVGAVMTGVGFLLCNWSPSFIALVVLGLFLNWFGDSLDGTLARFKHIERPRYGFLIDHASDLIAQSIIVIGLGCSPYFTLSSSLFVLSLYLLLSSYTYLRAAVEGVHRLAYGGLGATEFRIMVAVWPLFVEVVGPGVVGGRIFDHAGIDVVIGFLSICTYVIFIYLVRRDLVRLDAEEKRDGVAKETFARSNSAAAHTFAPSRSGEQKSVGMCTDAIVADISAARARPLIDPTFVQEKPFAKEVLN